MHTGNYATNFVKGIQEGDDATKVQIIATCKHFVANSLEGWTDAGGRRHTRHNFDAKISAQDLSNYYLPAFKTCVTVGKAKGIMCR
jgi:beta-D-xylosidase 4